MQQQEYLDKFSDTLQDMLELTKKKNADYSWQEDAFSSFKLVEKLWVCDTETWFITRMTDKMSRLNNLLKSWQQKVLDEKIEDTLLDLANYAIIMKLYLEERKRVSDLVDLATKIPND